MKVVQLSGLMVVFGLTAVLPLVARADEAADKKAEIQRLKDEAKKRAAERKAAATKALEDKAATDKPVTDEKATHAGKGGSGSGGATGAGGAASSGGASTQSAGGASSKGAGGASGAGGAATKVVEKDAPLPAGDIATLRKDRAERRKATVERLHRRWGNSLLADPKGAADLKQHARRVALLQRIRVIADAKKDKKSVEAVDELLTREDERHSRAMNALREGALK